MDLGFSPNDSHGRSEELDKAYLMRRRDILNGSIQNVPKQSGGAFRIFLSSTFTGIHITILLHVLIPRAVIQVFVI